VVPQVSLAAWRAGCGVGIPAGGIAGIEALGASVGEFRRALPQRR